MKPAVHTHTNCPLPVLLRIGCLCYTVMACDAGEVIRTSEAYSPQLNVLESDAGENSSTPHLSVGAQGPVMSWVSQENNLTSLYHATLNGERWSNKILVSSGSDWFNNWADYPSVVPIEGELWAAHWLQKSADAPYAYNVVLSQSLDGGKNWGKPVTPHSDNTPTEHGFVSIFSDAGNTAAVWLDGRKTGKTGAKYEQGMTLRSARLSESGLVEQAKLIDGLTCDCCATDAVLTSRGVLVAYRDRSESEIRDISVSRLENGQWSQPRTVAMDSWQVNGCPVNGPAIDAKDSRVVVAWFTRAQDRSRVNLAWSEDAGDSFSPALEIATQGTRGRVDVALLSNGQVAVSWMQEDRVNETAKLMLRLVNRDGSMTDVITIDELEDSRAAGFPQMIAYGDKLIFAWTDSFQGALRSAFLSIP